MKLVVTACIVLLVLVASAPVDAQPGLMSLYADLEFTTCHMSQPAGLITVYVVHEAHPGATTVQYALSDNSGGVLVHIADTNHYQDTVGSSQTGITVNYGGCIWERIHIQNVLYTVASNPATCTIIEIVTAPGMPSGRVESLDCSLSVRYPDLDRLIINSDGNCLCQPMRPVEAATWGKVKALYN